MSRDEPKFGVALGHRRLRLRLIRKRLIRLTSYAVQAREKTHVDMTSDELSTGYVHSVLSGDEVLGSYASSTEFRKVALTPSIPTPDSLRNPRAWDTCAGP